MMFGFRGAHGQRHARGPFAFGGGRFGSHHHHHLVVAGAGRSAAFSITAICAMSCCS